MTQKSIIPKRKHLILAPIIFLVGISGLLFWQIDRLIALNNWVDRSDQVVASINLLERQIIDLETGLKGFVITGDPIFLEPYYQSESEIPTSSKNLRVLAQGNPPQSMRIDRVVASLEDWKTLAKKEIKLKGSGGNASSLVKSLRGKIIIDSIRKSMGEMRTAEERLKAQRVSTTQLESKRIYWILLTTFALLLLGLSRNLTLRRRWEGAVQESEERFRLMVEGTTEYAIFMLDPQGRITTWNATAQRLKGYTTEEIIGKHFSIFYPPEDISAGKPDTGLKIAEREGRVEDEGWRVRKDGSRFWTFVNIAALFEHGQIKGYVKITRDLTEKKRVEDQLRFSEEKYRTLIANAHDGIVIVSEDGKIESANHQIEKMFGYLENELIGQPIEILVPDQIKRAHVAHRTEYSSHPNAREMGKGLNLFGKRKDATELAIDVSLSPTKNHTGTFVTAIVRDISERKEIEKERAGLLLKEQRANLTKDEFLATLSHELRTPLTAILSWVQLLRSGKLDVDKTRRGLEILELSAKAQGQLIDDLLDISRIQAGKLNLTIQKIDPRNVITAAIDSTRSLATSKSIQIETEIDPSVKIIFADPVRLQQILWNLITNAIRFSSQGGRIWIKLKGVAADRHICIQICDNGKGIKPEFLPIIFERFTQVDSSSTRIFGGLGLGLAIVRKLVEMHGGAIGVESAGEGKGATFTARLPVEPTVKIRTAEAEEVTLRGLRILVVEDEAHAREVFSVMLQSFSAEVKTAESASEAMSIFEDFKPNVLVSDIAMPIEDGYSLIGKIRALKSKLGQTPALALTAYAGQEDIQRTHLAGFQIHMAKPVDSNKLALAIARLAGRK